MQFGPVPWTPTAMLALIFFPFIAHYIGNRFKNPLDGAVWVFLAATLFLPERTNIDFPLVPAISKHQLAPIMALVTLWRRDPKIFSRVRPFRGVEAVMLLFFFGAVAQVPANEDPVVWEAWPDPIVLPGMSYKEAVSNILWRAITYWMPFYVGRLVIQNSQQLRQVLKHLVVAGFIYSFLSIVEQVMSPQLHIWIYGFHQHDFGQTRRMGGWRPTIFMVHGLNTAMFMLTVANASVTLARIKEKALKYAPKSLAIYQCVHVLLMKSTGVIIYGFVTLPIAAVSKPRAQMSVCWAFAAICALYPWSKVQDFFPREQIEQFITEKFDAERAESMFTRFANDDMLSDRGHERFWFGWGGYGRMEVFNVWGKQITIPDAEWIALFGSSGLCGLVSFFLISLWPIFSASRAMTRIKDPTERILLSALAVMSVTYSIDMLLNSMQNGFPMFLAGGLLGLTEGMLRTAGRGGPGMPMAVPQPMAARAPRAVA